VDEYNLRNLTHAAEGLLSAAIFSGVIFLICLGLYAFVDRVDSEVRGSGNGV
jgi:hypothetical protein